MTLFLNECLSECFFLLRNCTYCRPVHAKGKSHAESRSQCSVNLVRVKGVRSETVPGRTISRSTFKTRGFLSMGVSGVKTVITGGGES